jgi:hypothetical protein
MTTLFSWDDDIQEKYETPDQTPIVDPIRDMPGQVVNLLSGGRMITHQLDASDAILIREGVKLTWELTDPSLLTIIENTYAAGRSVTVVYPWHGSTATITGRIPPNGKIEYPEEGNTTRLEVTILEM